MKKLRACITGMCLLFSTQALPQSLFVFPNTVSATGPNERIQASVLNDQPEKLVLDDARTYAWFKNGHIYYTQGGYSGKLLHGRYTAMYDNGSDLNILKESGMYQYGLKEGTWKAWYTNGTLAEWKNYKSGRLHGEWKQWSEKGTLIHTGNYRNGLKHGKFVYEVPLPAKTEVYKKGILVPPPAARPVKNKKGTLAKTDSLPARAPTDVPLADTIKTKTVIQAKPAKKFVNKKTGEKSDSISLHKPVSPDLLKTDTARNKKTTGSAVQPGVMRKTPVSPEKKTPAGQPAQKKPVQQKTLVGPPEDKRP